MPINQVLTRYADNPSKSNLMIDLMFFSGQFKRNWHSHNLTRLMKFFQPCSLNSQHHHKRRVHSRQVSNYYQEQWGRGRICQWAKEQSG